MAIVRCVEHIPEGKDGGYVISIEPLGYPETAAVCGRKECNNPGLVWLKRDEHQEYIDGQRVFDMHTQTISVKVK